MLLSSIYVSCKYQMLVTITVAYVTDTLEPPNSDVTSSIRGKLYCYGLIGITELIRLYTQKLQHCSNINDLVGYTIKAHTTKNSYKPCS